MNNAQSHASEKAVLVYVLTIPALRETGLGETLLSLEPLGLPSILSSIPMDEHFVVMTESSLEKKSSSASYGEEPEFI